MKTEYIETFWWIIKQIWKKNCFIKIIKLFLIAQDAEPLYLQHEVAQGYEKIKENSIYVKFPVKNQPNTYLLVWTTTPWTLPGNVAVAVNPEFVYVKVKLNNEYLILAKERIEASGINGEIEKEFKGKDLLGLEYEPLFDFEKPDKKAYFIISGNFVSLEEGTGLVHIAPAFGEDDMTVGKENNLPVILNVDEEGKFKQKLKIGQECL